MSFESQLTQNPEDYLLYKLKSIVGHNRFQLVEQLIFRILSKLRFKAHFVIEDTWLSASNPHRGEKYVDVGYGKCP